MNYLIDIQNACTNPLPISESSLKNWAIDTLKTQMASAELTLRLVDIHEITTLNNLYRHQDKPTNVLAFPSNLPDAVQLDFPFIGDVIICPEVLEQEAIEQGKLLESHWAHIVIHGVLHLLGFDHIEKEEALQMQTQEIQLLNNLNIANPYHEDHDSE